MVTYTNPEGLRFAGESLDVVARLVARYNSAVAWSHVPEADRRAQVAEAKSHLRTVAR